MGHLEAERQFSSCRHASLGSNRRRWIKVDTNIVRAMAGALSRAAVSSDLAEKIGDSLFSFALKSLRGPWFSTPFEQQMSSI